MRRFKDWIKLKLKSNSDRFLQNISGVVHVGANTGQERELYDKLNLRVIWIEPIPEVFETLQTNLKNFPDQRAFNALITDCDNKEYPFHVANNYGASSSILDLKQHKDVWPDVNYTNTILLKSTTLTSLFEKECIDPSNYQVLIMDTQGSELLVLKGSISLLHNFTYIKTEVWDVEIYTGCCQIADINSFMTQHGFIEFSRKKVAKRPKGGSCFDITYQRKQLTERLKSISPKEERERIRVWLKKRREKDEIPVNLPERPKVFIAVKSTNWEKTGLVDSWQELADVIHYDWGEKYNQYNRRNWQKTGKRLFNEELLGRIKAEHLKQPVQIFLSYLSGRSVFPQTIKQISEMGIITVNIGFDDTRSFRGKKKRTGWTGNAEIAPYFDICITCQNRNDIIKYLKAGANPIFFPPGGNHRFWASNSPSPNRTIPVSFIGQNYGRRQKIVNRLRKAGIPVITYGRGWPEGEISQEKMREVYGNSLVTLGFGYISKTNLVGLKGRDFEVPLTGTAYLTTYHEELAQNFLPDKEMIFYVDEEDLLRKVRYYLDNPEKAKEIGLAGRKKALAEHTWEKRWQEILEVCR